MSPSLIKVSSITEHPGFSQEGDLRRLQDYTDRLRAGAELTQLDYLGYENLPEGQIHRFGFVTKNGYAHSGNLVLPYEPTSDIPVLATGAWYTSPRGHNQHTALKHAEDGLAFIWVGNEGSYRPKRLAVPKKDMTLADASAAALSFSESIAPQFKYLIHPSLRTAVGESKGGMEGMGHLALASAFNQEILMADFTAPCIPRKLKSQDGLELARQIADEPVALARLIGRLSLGLISHYPATIDPLGLPHQIAKSIALFSGEAGDLGRLVPKDQILHISTFKGDFASMQSEWEDIFKHHANVRITPLAGNHLTLADPETLAYIRARQQAFRDLYTANNRDISQVSGDDVFDLAHSYVESYKSPVPQSPLNKLARLVLGNKGILPAA